MRWQSRPRRKSEPQEGDRRWHQKLVWLPKRLPYGEGRQWRWLERCWVLQESRRLHHLFSAPEIAHHTFLKWCDVRWG